MWSTQSFINIFMKKQSLKNWNYKIVGVKNAPRIVFLHGIMGSLSNWLKVAAYFKNNFEILLFDQRGHGRSRHQNSYKIKDYVADLEFICKELAWDKFHLVGHSSGAITAAQYTYANPDKVLSLCIEDMSMEPQKDRGLKIEKLLLSIPRVFKDKNTYDDFFKNKIPFLTQDFFQADLLANFLSMNMSRQADGTRQWRFDRDGVIQSLKEARAKSFYKNYFSISCPILVFRGNESKDLPFDEYQKMLSHKNAQGLELQSGHWVHIQQCKAFSKALLDFIDGLC